MTEASPPQQNSFRHPATDLLSGQLHPSQEFHTKRLGLRIFRSKLVRVVLLLILALVFLSQIPFVYRRYELGRLRAQIEALKSQRVTPETEGEFNDYRGVIHVHSSLGGHSTGNLRNVVEAARANELHFVLMTEHTARELATASLTLNGRHGDILFVGGSEIAAASGERLLLVPGSLATSNIPPTASDVLGGERSSGQLRFIAYPAEFRSWEAEGYDGIEIYNLFTNARDIRLSTMIFDGLWSYGSYPDLLFARFYQRPEASLEMWDTLTVTTRRRIVAIAGVDAHQNVGLRFGDASGNDFFSLQLDPYERSFGTVRTHILIERDRELNTENLLEALHAGHAYFSFDMFADATGFRFTAEDANEQRVVGDEIRLDGEARLRVTTPLTSRIVLFKDGRTFAEAREVSQHEFSVRETGVYRVEVYLPQLELVGNQPWIISNPIYIR